MLKLHALDRYEIAGRGTVLIVESPVQAKRTFEALRDAIGRKVEIDGIVYEPIGYEMKMPLTDVAVGERIGALVPPNARNQRPA